MASDLRRLDLRVSVPELGQREGAVQLRPFVDGEDLLARGFPDEPGVDPGLLLVAGGPLEAGPVARTARLAESECTQACCGALDVTVRQVGDEVVWNDWRNTADDRITLPELRFAAAQYHAELARAVADHGWEWPARTVARLLEERLRAEGARAEGLRREDRWPDRWECELRWVAAWHWEPERVRVGFLDRRGSTADGLPRHRILLEFPVTAQEPADRARALAERLLAGDPRELSSAGG
ncbi:hypothetical protein GCM10009665_54780 [Kitasatospora nipponensis]|uniref:DUF2470 domain-containing protein n=1 Tax=Kitasatospora nipponensis TaxID=258049 RepID=A0ABP4HCD6_9ACTN